MLILNLLKQKEILIDQKRNQVNYGTRYNGAHETRYEQYKYMI